MKFEVRRVLGEANIHSQPPTETCMPLVKMPFRPHLNTQFNVQVNTPEEQGVCDLFAEATREQVNEELVYLDKLANYDPTIANEPFYIFTRMVVSARKTTTDRPRPGELGKLLGSIMMRKVRIETAVSRAGTTQTASQPATVLVGPAPAGRSLLGGIFDSIMTDRIAYSKIDPNSNALPSTQYIQAKAEATVLWDVLMGRR
jgi:hypothetical protein